MKDMTDGAAVRLTHIDRLLEWAATEASICLHENHELSPACKAHVTTLKDELRQLHNYIIRINQSFNPDWDGPDDDADLLT